MSKMALLWNMLTTSLKTSKMLSWLLSCQKEDLLDFASSALKKSPKIVKAALKQDGLALQFAFADLCSDISVVEIAVQQNNLKTLCYGLACL